jgi:hypothetical protein
MTVHPYCVVHDQPLDWCSHSAPATIQDHQCDDECDQIECLIGVSAVYKEAPAEGYECRNCAWWNEVVPERCPQCLFPVVYIRDMTA